MPQTMTFDLIQALCKKTDAEILEELGPCSGAFEALRMVRKLRVSMQVTPIEVVAATLAASGVIVDNVLVPEQCFEMWLNDGGHYHVTVEPIPE